jgi:uncharacterized protein with PQ loop repeat
VIVTILAWTGAFLSCLLTIPQAVRTLRSDQLDGLSATTYWLIFGNAAAWGAWSVLAGEYAAGVPSLVNGPAALLILHRMHHSQRPVARVTQVQVAPCEPALPLEALLVKAERVTFQRPAAATVSSHASAQAAPSNVTPDFSLLVHGAHTSIDSTSILRNMSSGSSISAWAAPSTAQRTMCGAACLRKAAGRGGRLLLNWWAQYVASGTVPSTRSLSGDKLPPGRPSSCANIRSQTKTETASTRCRSAAATGNAIVVQRRAIKASMCKSSPFSPITDGIKSAKCGRPSSEVWSLTRRATDASSECVHAG